PGYGQPGYGQPGYGQPGQPGYGPQGPYQPGVRTRLEIGYLYTTAIVYGVGVGIWGDAEAYNGKKFDPGIGLIAPLIFGAAMPMAVFLADLKPMREGLPSAIASGLIIGAGEGMVSAAFVSGHHAVNTPDPVNFTYFGRAEVIGSTLGLGAGI